MAISITSLRSEASAAVLSALTELYKETSPDPDAMRGFAEALAEIAVATAEHLIDRAETAVSGENII